MINMSLLFRARRAMNGVGHNDDLLHTGAGGDISMVLEPVTSPSEDTNRTLSIRKGIGSGAQASGPLCLRSETGPIQTVRRSLVGGWDWKTRSARSRLPALKTGRRFRR